MESSRSTDQRWGDDKGSQESPPAAPTALRRSPGSQACAWWCRDRDPVRGAPCPLHQRAARMRLLQRAADGNPGVIQNTQCPQTPGSYPRSSEQDSGNGAPWQPQTRSDEPGQGPQPGSGGDRAGTTDKAPAKVGPARCRAREKLVGLGFSQHKWLETRFLQ